MDVKICQMTKERQIYVLGVLWFDMCHSTGSLLCVPTGDSNIADNDYSRMIIYSFSIHQINSTLLGKVVKSSEWPQNCVPA